MMPWHFRFGYGSRSEQHLMELRGHIHYLMRRELVIQLTMMSASGAKRTF